MSPSLIEIFIELSFLSFLHHSSVDISCRQNFSYAEGALTIDLVTVSIGQTLGFSIQIVFQFLALAFPGTGTKETIVD